MPKTIGIIDYGAGNLTSVEKAFSQFNVNPIVTHDIHILKKCDGLVLPGQGAFGSAMAYLKDRNLIDFLKDAIHAKTPYFGICLGFQLLFDHSEEDGGVEGLGIFEGKIEKFKSKTLKVPHMGWNQVEAINDPNQILDPTQKPNVYFVHSFYKADGNEDWVSTKTHYGIPFVSSLQTETVFASQFHPEKSGAVGLKIIENFLKSQTLI